MSVDVFDIIVSGGGLAGMLAAAATGSMGFRVLCVDPAIRDEKQKTPIPDTRTTAIFYPSLKGLGRTRVAQAILADASPIRSMRVFDTGSALGIRRSATFEADEIGESAFGWNVVNEKMTSVLAARIASLSSVEFRQGTSTVSCMNRDRDVLAELSDGSFARGRLLIAADGRNSVVRASLGIGSFYRGLGQRALAFSTSHEVPHEDCSSEIYRSGGPLTLIPRQPVDGMPSSAVVWMDQVSKLRDVERMGVRELENALMKRACSIFGRMKLESAVRSWPVCVQLAQTFAYKRTVLIAEAAHVLPPIGAQGLNLSLSDIESLCALLERHPLGSSQFAFSLSRTARRQRSLARAKLALVSMLNQMSMMSANDQIGPRGIGIGLADRFRPIRVGLMRLGLN